MTNEGPVTEAAGMVVGEDALEDPVRFALPDVLVMLVMFLTICVAQSAPMFGVNVEAKPAVAAAKLETGRTIVLSCSRAGTSMDGKPCDVREITERLAAMSVAETAVMIQHEAGALAVDMDRLFDAVTAAGWSRVHLRRSPGKANGR